MFKGSRIHLFGVLVAATLLATSFASPASAEDDRERARKAYDRGLVAHKRGAFAVAANEFALADALAPSAVALRAAVDAAVSADDPVLGMELVGRSKRAVSPPDLAASLDKARAAFAGRTGRVVLVCNEGAPCEGSVDGTVLAVGKERVMRIGDHAVRLRASGGEESRVVRIVADDVVELRPSAASGAVVVPTPTPTPTPATASSASAPPTVAPPPASPGPAGPPVPQSPSPSPSSDKAESRKPLPPIFVVVGAGLTAIAGGVSVWSALDTKSTHDTFVSTTCSTTSSTECTTLASSGRSAQTRTNVLLATTGGLSVVTLIVAVFLVDWGGPTKAPERSASLRRWDFGPLAGPQLAGVRLGGTF